ncbi:hypothetical protein [Streptomyces sp. ALI-76-A]|uniref:hypothetical protein n=1 Tax=Streptomyces sp. ALI-76-A TaxID=3025736 RepID=UPI00256F15ED|nr:hypothetical protein [Streptomyces sp. ALI-76-A]MDL5199583.1 hypothetical protein [Streptomyces sp. ALI-76-A]
MADTVTIPADVAHAFTDTWCCRLTSDVAAALNCAEVETLAELLRAFGAEQAADEWIDAHADGDEPGEEHFQGPVPDEVSFAADGYRCTPDDLTGTKE